jgi:anthranilate synthase component 2
MKVLIIDCHDSFTYNLFQLVGSLGAEPVVITRDQTIRDARSAACDRIILSPGPGHPSGAQLCTDVVRTLGSETPVLGVCLGHQVICTAYGGIVGRAPEVMHGKTSRILHDGKGVFSGMESSFKATRYHSLVADASRIPPELVVTATAADDGCIMGVRHRQFPIEGVQFHPESIFSEMGATILSNFLEPDYGRMVT